MPQSVLDYLKVYYGILLANKKLYRDRQCRSSLSLGGDPALDAVMEWIRRKVSQMVGLDLAPTYSYTRRYAKGEELVRHTDRAACEISVTVAIQIPKRAKPSAIYLQPPQLNETKVELREGDGCIYAGTEVEHWRRPFRADGYVQLFLHFIAKQGRHYPQLQFDGRERLGAAYPVRRTSRRQRKNHPAKNDSR